MSQECISCWVSVQGKVTAQTRHTMTGGQHAVASLPAASRIGDRGSAERSLSTPWDPLARPTCRPEAYHGFAAWVVVSGVAARDAGSVCPRASQPGSNRRHRSRFRPMALARSSRPEGRSVSDRAWSKDTDSMNAYLDEILSFGLGDERLQLRGREGVDQAGLRHD